MAYNCLLLGSSSMPSNSFQVSGMYYLINHSSSVCNMFLCISLEESIVILVLTDVTMTVICIALQIFLCSRVISVFQTMTS